ncbi:hypothetical protein Emed_002324 [Eimeria media]
MLHQPEGSTLCELQASPYETTKRREFPDAANIFGRQSHSPITINGSKAVFFPASNTGVVHIYHTDDKGTSARATQLLLQGHTNRISAVAVSEDKELIATGDAGQADAGGQEEIQDKKDPCFSFSGADTTPAETYQGVAIWKWKDSGQVHQKF